jgi:hypothetical protein
MSKMEITSSEEVPDLKSKIYTLEPAIGLIGGKLAYVIQFLPTETRKAGKLPTRVFKPWVIFSDHTVVQWNKEKLIRLGLYPSDGLTRFLSAGVLSRLMPSGAARTNLLIQRLFLMRS